MIPAIKNFRLGAALAVCALLFCAPLASGQNVLNQTTLAGALSATSSTLAINSATGITNPGPNQSALTVLLVEREIILVNSISGTIANVARGQYGTLRVAHANATVVWVAPDKALARGALPSGSCTRTSMPYVPLIFVAPTGVNAGMTGSLFDCLGGQIVQTDQPTTFKGSDVASANTITPTGTFFVVSGTTTVKTITVPAGWAAGNCLAIEPTGIFATDTTGNIGLTSSATVVGRILFMCWDGSKWYPSYVS